MDNEEIRAELERFGADGRWVNKHRNELLAKYPDQVIAVYNQQVVGASKDPRRLVRQLERKGLDPGRVYRKFLSTSDQLVIVHIG